MAVREKTLTRSLLAVKHSATPCGLRAQSHNDLVNSFHLTFRPSSNICHTTPISDSTDPANASPHETHAAPADTPQIPPPLHIASTRDTAPGSAPADQPCPHLPAAPALASSLSSNARTASYSEIPPAAPTERRKTIRPPPDDPPSQTPKSDLPCPRPKPPP